MAEKVKEKIIAVAQETFKKFGFRKTTMDEIAYAARKGKSSLYYYFKSKEEVFKEVVELEAQTLKSQVLEAINTESDPKQQLRKYIIARMNGFKMLSNFYVAIKDDFLSNLDFIESARRKYDQEEIEMVSAILKNGIEKNIFKKLDITLTAKTIAIIMKSLEIPLFITQENLNIENNVDELLNILYFGISS
jgi:AcrR family transcriptional regulator